MIQFCQCHQMVRVVSTSFEGIRWHFFFWTNPFDLARASSKNPTIRLQRERPQPLGFKEKGITGRNGFVLAANWADWEEEYYFRRAKRSSRGAKIQWDPKRSSFIHTNDDQWRREKEIGDARRGCQQHFSNFHFLFLSHDVWSGGARRFGPAEFPMQQKVINVLATKLQ